MGLKKAIRRKLRSFGLLRDVEAIKISQARHYFELFDGTVAYGAFAGFKLQKGQYWNHYDISAKLFGLYEQQVTAQIVAVTRFRDVHYIGAADVFGVAAVSQGYFDKSYFEISRGAAKHRPGSAEWCAEDKVEILGAADPASEPGNGHAGGAVVLIDTEGAEFDFPTDQVIGAGARIINRMTGASRTDWLSVMACSAALKRPLLPGCYHGST